MKTKMSKMSNMSKMHPISSSDTSDLEEFSDSDQESSTLDMLQKKENLVEYDFSQVQSSNTLFYEDITEDDELWLLQCPKSVSLKDLRVDKINFDLPVSNIKCKTEENKKKFSIYSVPPSSSQISLALPNLEKKNFLIKTLPVAGQLIFQEKISFKQKNVSDSCMKEEPSHSFHAVKENM